MLNNTQNRKLRVHHRPSLYNCLKYLHVTFMRYVQIFEHEYLPEFEDKSKRFWHLWTGPNAEPIYIKKTKNPSRCHVHLRSRNNVHYTFIIRYGVVFTSFRYQIILTCACMSGVQWTVLYLDLSGSVDEIQGLQFIRILSPHPQIWCRYSHLKNKGYRQCSYQLLSRVFFFEFQ